MPKPIPGESEKNYLKRCIPVVLKEGTAKDEKQAAAICYSMFKRKKAIGDNCIDKKEVSVGYLKSLEDEEKPFFKGGDRNV